MQAKTNGISQIPAFSAEFPEDCFIARNDLTRESVWEAIVTLLLRNGATLRRLDCQSDASMREVLDGLASQAEQGAALMRGIKV